MTNKKFDSDKDVVEIEKAIRFLVNSVETSGDTEKPIITHSIRVGLYLKEKGYGKEIIIAGLLHDLLEDSEISFEEIEKKFGEKIAKLVQANSFDKNIKDKRKRYQQTLNQCLKAGKDALVIKAADILDNSFYYRLAKTQNLYDWLLAKMKDFIGQSKKFLKNEIVWKDLKSQYNQLIK